MTEVPTSYLDAMDDRLYQTAAHDASLREQADAGDALALALLHLADGYLHEAQGDPARARKRFEEVVGLLEKEGDAWKVNAVRQQASACLEYMAMGKPLPALPSGL